MPIVLDGFWVRHARHARNPLPGRDPHRWQRGAVVDAPNSADSEATAWAEWFRYLAESGIPTTTSAHREVAPPGTNCFSEGNESKVIYVIGCG